MTQEEMTRIILAYEKEMREWKDETADTFGLNDSYTKRLIAQWLAVEELLIRLNLKPL
jgi:hypothetical protein